MDLALLLIRLAVGLTMAAHGAQKLFGWFHGHGLAGTAGFLESLGFPRGRLFASLLGGTELAAGLGLAAGFLTPLAAAGVAGVMLAATVVVHWDKGFFNTEGGYEFPLVLGTSALATAFSGAGRWSLDHLFGWTLGDEAWGVAALVLAVVAAAGAVSARSVRMARGSRRPVTA